MASSFRFVALALAPIFILGALFAIPIPFKSENVDQILTAIDAHIESGKSTTKEDQALAKALADPQTNLLVRARCARALGELNGQSGVPALIKTAGHKGAILRGEALDALISLRAKTALNVLTEISKADPILSFRQRATIGLGLLKSDKAIDPLVKLSADEREEVRGAAALAMGALHSSANDFREILSEIKADPSPYVQQRAKAALDAANRNNKALLAHLESEDSDFRMFAAVYFEEHGRSGELAALKAAQNAESQNHVRRAMARASTQIEKRVAAAKAEERKRKAAQAAKKKLENQKKATTR